MNGLAHGKKYYSVHGNRVNGHVPEKVTFERVCTGIYKTFISTKFSKNILQFVLVFRRIVCKLLKFSAYWFQSDFIYFTIVKPEIMLSEGR